MESLSVGNSLTRSHPVLILEPTPVRSQPKCFLITYCVLK